MSVKLKQDKKGNKYWVVEFGTKNSLTNPRYRTQYSEKVHGKYAKDMAEYIFNNKIREPIYNWFSYQNDYVIIYCYMRTIDKYFEIKVDIDDYESKLKYRHWGVYENTTKPGQYYFRSKTKLNGETKNSALKLHRYIMGLEDKDRKIIVDHINGDTLDNRKSNLRLVDHSKSVRNRDIFKNNTSGQTGVEWDKRYNTWIAKYWDDESKLHKKSFNPINYNNNIQEAFEAAKEFRLQKEKEYYFKDKR